MAKDAELDRLGSTQNRAFENKQSAHRTLEAAWNQRRAVSDRMNAAYAEQDRAYNAQQSSWQDLQRLRDSYGPQIEQLNADQERAYQDMGRAFSNATAAHDRRDGAGAKSYAEEGHGYKAKSQGYVAERRRLVGLLRTATAQHQSVVQVFQAAKDRFRTVKEEFAAAKSAHEKAQSEFKAAKEVFDQASKAFQARLAIVKANNAKRADDKRSIAERAGIPYAHRDKFYIKKDSDGTVQIYFGGVGEPNGLGHGHYTMDSSGKVIYKREPFDPHGAQNFTENRREAATRNMAQMAMNQWAKTQKTPRMTQFDDSEFKVTVQSGYSRDHDCITTDVLIFDKQNKKEHYHLVLDDQGRELFSEWRPNR